MIKKSNWSYAVKHATTTTKTKVTKVRAKPLPKTIRTADINASAMLSRLCCFKVNNWAFYANRVMHGRPI